MRAVLAGLTVVFVSSSGVFAQPAAPAPPAGGSRTMVSAADVAALIAKAKVDRKENQALLAQSMIRLAPYNVSLEYRAAVANAAVHETEAELFYVIDGSATLVTGGQLVSPTRNGDNLTGTAIQGGTSHRKSKGDFMLIPQGVPHWITNVQGSFTPMTLHLPMSAQEAKSGG